MAQGYPPPQYPQNGYGQPQPPQNGYGPNPYAQSPYGQQPYPAQQQPYPPQYQQQYQQQPYAASPYPQAQPTLPPCPEEAFAGRRFLAIVLDFVLALGAGFAAAVADDNTAKHAKPVVHAVGHAAVQSSVVPFWVAFLGVGLITSFLNQVVLARLTGFSVGKGILAMRVVRRKRVMRPNMWRLTRRWLLGFVFLAVVLISEDFDVSEGDVVGMRSVRWKHLQEYEQAVGRLG
ncbi:RDD family protein [Kitasatospora sp. NPDC058190]|uniref:RDD family protein n=1 Tax=Kitasatospora sp. NPDC058190 TaxID=3346371 RepID=UPI0036D865A3